MRSKSAVHRIAHAFAGIDRDRTLAKVVQWEYTHLQTGSEHPPRPTPLRLPGPTPRTPSTRRPRPPRPPTSLTEKKTVGPRLAVRPRGACSASLGSASPRTPPEAGPVPATPRSKATPRPRIGCPPPSAAGLIMTVKHHAHGQNELFRPGLLPSRSPPGQEERQVSFPGGEQPSRRPARSGAPRAAGCGCGGCQELHARPRVAATDLKRSARSTGAGGSSRACLASRKLSKCTRS